MSRDLRTVQGKYKTERTDSNCKDNVTLGPLPESRVFIPTRAVHRVFLIKKLNKNKNSLIYCLLRSDEDLKVLCPSIKVKWYNIIIL